MAKDAIEGYLDVLADEGRPLPQPAAKSSAHAAPVTRGRVGTRLDAYGGRIGRLGAERSQVQILSPRLR